MRYEQSLSSVTAECETDQALYTVTVNRESCVHYAEETTEQNRIPRTGKSESKVINKKNCARGIVLLKLTIRHRRFWHATLTIA